MKIKELFKKKDINKNKDENIDSKKSYEVLINGIDTFVLLSKDENERYILIKDKNFPYMLNNPDLEWIEMNKKNFDYYGEFYSFSSIINQMQTLYVQEILKQKTEDEYLKDYLEHSNPKYFKIIEKMKLFEIDGKQYAQFANQIKTNIDYSINKLLENYTNMNSTLYSERTYEEIKNDLESWKSFKEKFPYFFEVIQKEKNISHCGYPDYMWQSGAERNIHKCLQYAK